MTFSVNEAIDDTDYLLSSKENRELIEKAKAELESGDIIEFVVSLDNF